MGKLFGTDGVRGVANIELTPELAFKLGRAGAYVLTKTAKSAPTVLIAKDSRRSGDMLEAALTAGLCSIGAHVLQVGVLPTPAVAYLIRHYQVDAGVMISASHNPMQDNGIKFFQSDGYKLSYALEDEIEALLEDDAFEKLPRPEGKDVGEILPMRDAEGEYVTYLLSCVPDLRLDGMKIALDCANGATSHVAPLVFQTLGAQIYTLHNTPDGININANCGSTHMETLMDYVVSEKTDIGLAFDGDGDRMLATNEKGELIDGDVILAVTGLYMKKQGLLSNNAIVATIMSNQGLEKFCKENDIMLFRTDVGDRYVLEKMLADDFALGGEQSGHVIFKNYSTTGDGILSALMLLQVLANTKKTMSETAGIIEIFPQVLVNAKVPNQRKTELKTNMEILKAQAAIETEMAGEGRILVRPSGTEPKVRVMIEGKNQAQLESWANSLADVIESNLN